jgi:Bacterial archaeo-eukaryotic release factor family 10
MPTPALIQSLPELAAPVLTVYLDTNQARQINRGLKPGYLTRLESQVKLIARTVSQGHAEAFREQVARVEAYLRSHPLRCRGIAIFAGRDVWESVPLQAEVEDEVHWGAPALAQLYWMLDEHKPYGIVVAGQKRVYFFLYWLQEMLELEEKEFQLEPAKKKEMGKVSRSGGVRMSRGTNRDVFEHHVNADCAHYQRQIAERVERWCATEHLQSVFLVGLSEMARGIWKELPVALRERAIPIEENLGWMPRPELQRRLQPIVHNHECEREVALVDALLGDDRGVVVGIDETLIQLQKGTVRNVLILKGLEANLRRCSECLWADRSSDPRCPACGRERYAVTLRQLLPELARRYNISLEVVSGEAARRLQAAGGMGAWLREFERKEYGQRQTFA